MQYPGEFHYWDNLDRRPVRWARRAVKAALGFDPAPRDEVVRTFASMYYDADPVAEAFVDEVYLGRSRREGRELLERALAGGLDAIDDPPRSLVELWADLEREPDWLDPELVELGARVFRRWGTDIFRFAGAITLQAYSESSVAKPLALTGAYAGKTARHRFLETAAFWIAVSEPGGLRPGAPGFAAALRVRIMHVFVRQRLLGHREWNRDAWGVPISQADAMLTLMGGSFVPGFAMRVLGYRPSAREIEATMHFWRYVGHLMGVRPRWYPGSLREAGQLMFMTLVKAAHRAGDDERALWQAYGSAFEPAPDGTVAERLRARLEHRVHVGYTRLFLPRGKYRRYQMPPAGLWWAYPLARAPLVFCAETLRRRFRVLDGLADRVARRDRRRWFAHHMGERAARYEAASGFTR